MNTFMKYLLGFLLMQANPAAIVAQIRLEGATCVRPGLEYQYNLITSSDSAVEISICISGGRIVGYSDTCIHGITKSFVGVIWNSNAERVKLWASAKDDSVTLNAQVALPLQAGTIDSSLRFQFLSDNTMPLDILCSMPTGGSCTPQYSFQWQSSVDALAWMDMPGAVQPDLKFTQRPTQSLFYRRLVTDLSSSDVTFSAFVSIFISQNSL